MIRIELRQLPPDSCMHIPFCLLVLAFIGSLPPKLPINLLQVCHRQARSRSIVFRYCVDNIDGLRIQSLPHEVLWALIKLEDEETKRPEDEHESTHDVKEIAPAHVLALRTVCAWDVGFT